LVHSQHLSTLLAEVETEITHLSVEEPWSDQLAFVMQLPGAGLLSGMTILSTIGGDLMIHAEPDKTLVTLTSSAPILQLTMGHTPSVTDLLAAEAQVLLAPRGPVRNQVSLSNDWQMLPH
jgi:hypothetical protein